MIKIVFLLFLAIPLWGFAQPDGEIIMTIDNQPVLKEEFVRLYRKNNQNLMAGAEKKSPEEYLDLFINYKLKVREAQKLGLDTLPEFRNEFRKYRAEVAKPYLTNAEYTEEQVETAYYRTTHEIKASHILLLLDENATPADTLTVWNKLMELRKQVSEGADFNELAAQYSQDPSAKQNKGLLGYFSSFQMVFPFEDAAFITPVGEVSMPVRSRFGYHLIMVHDLRPAAGQLKVAHIMKRIPENTSEEAVNRLKTEMDSLAMLARSGADFAQLARQHSDDQRSASVGGELPWFTRGNMLPEFAEAAFALPTDGAISYPVRTSYGWHLIKRLEHKPVPPLEEMRESLIDQIRRNPDINKLNHETLINRLKLDWDYRPFEDNFEEFARQAESAITGGRIQPADISTPEELLFTFSNGNMTFADFADYLTMNRFEQPATFHSQLKQLYEQFVAKKLMEAEDERLEEKHPEFRHLVQEYHDGILLFNLSEKKIWQVAAEDSLGLERYFKQAKYKYLWGERFQGWVIQCQSQEERDFVDQVLAADSQLPVEELKDRFKIEFNRELTAQKGAFEKGDHPLVDHLVWFGPKPTDFRENLHFIHGNKVEPQPKTLNETRGQYMADYQQYLENNWIRELRKKYRVKVNKKIIESIESVK